MKQTLPLQTRLATLQPRSANADTRTIEVVWSSGAAVKRYDFWSDEAFYEQLDLAGANLSRLNAGAPVLNSHQDWGLNNVIGVVERAWIDGDEGRAELRLSDRADVEPIWRDLQNGILRNVSIGYAVDTAERIRAEKKGDPDTLMVRAFTPAEISIVPIPADYRAQVRAESPVYSVEIKEPVMDLDVEAAAAVVPEAPAAVEPPAVPEPPVAVEPPVDVPAIADAARSAERSRIVEIIRACKLANLPELADALIERGVSLDVARAEIIDAWAERGGAEIRQPTAPDRGDPLAAAVAAYRAAHPQASAAVAEAAVLRDQPQLYDAYLAHRKGA